METNGRVKKINESNKYRHDQDNYHLTAYLDFCGVSFGGGGVDVAIGTGRRE